MAVTQKINIQLGSATSDRIDRGMFGTNALSDVNTDADGNPTQGFIQAVRDLNVTDLRFPGGTIEGANDILAETVGNRLSPQATNFLNWVRGENANGLDLTVTLAIPSKRPITYDEVYNFARIVARDYPDLVKAVEIGNEYSIGETTINETIYGQRADIAARALADGFAAQGLIGDAQPDIVLQMAEIFGHGSSFSGTGDHLFANQELIAQLSTPAIKAIDGVVNHYYYIEEHQFDENFADQNNQGEINRETRFLFKKLEAFEDAWSDVAGSKQLDFYMTEWNVNRLNYDQHGLKAASALLQQFSYMVEMGVETAHIWPIQHKTGSAFAGSALGPSNPGPGATLFSLLSDSLSHDGAYNMKLMDLTGTSVPRGVSIEAFQNDEKTVLYVSSRADGDQNIRLDLRSIASQINGYSAVIVGYDKASSDGLSEMADPNGSNRTIKREISAFEYEKLKKLPFFDINNPDHISISEAANGTLRYKPYLPTADDIIPLVNQPKTIKDYYFASESDTLGELEYLSQQQLGGKEAVSFTLNPYEVIEITVTHGQEIVAPQPTTLTHVTGTTSPTHVQFAQIEGKVHLTAAAFDAMFQLGAQSKGLPNLDLSAATNYTAGDDQVFGTDKSDFINGLDGKDIIHASGGNDTILGGTGSDTISGGNGDDYINGGAGADRLTGGDGADMFVFLNPQSGVCDVITDFDVNEDQLVFAGVSAGTKIGQFHNITVENMDGDASITYNDYCVLLEGVDAQSVDINDFLFV